MGLMLPQRLLEGSFFWKRAVSQLKNAKDCEIPKLNIPEGNLGRFHVQRFTVKKRDALLFNTEQIQACTASRMMLPGTFTRLLEITGTNGQGQETGHLWMSDSRAEREDHIEIYKKAKELGGRILVHGLGLGVIVNALLELDNVEHVEVWELNEEIIELCGRFYEEKFGDRLTIVHGDVWQHCAKKNEAWSIVWHDIWPSLGSKNLKEMQRLCARFRTRCDWQECWGRDFCRWMAKQERNDERSGPRGSWFHPMRRL